LGIFFSLTMAPNFDNEDDLPFDSAEILLHWLYSFQMYFGYNTFTEIARREALEQFLWYKHFKSQLKTGLS